jgi:hypothetical protein
MKEHITTLLSLLLITLIIVACLNNLQQTYESCKNAICTEHSCFLCELIKQQVSTGREKMHAVAKLICIASKSIQSLLNTSVGGNTSVVLDEGNNIGIGIGESLDDSQYYKWYWQMVIRAQNNGYPISHPLNPLSLLVACCY